MVLVETVVGVVGMMTDTLERLKHMGEFKRWVEQNHPIIPHDICNTCKKFMYAKAYGGVVGDKPKPHQCNDEPMNRVLQDLDLRTHFIFSTHGKVYGPVAYDDIPSEFTETFTEPFPEPAITITEN